MLIYSKIHSQQNANNAQRTMKKEDGCIQFCHHFFFSLLFVVHNMFVEDKLKVYNTIFQCVTIHSQQFNAFIDINKSAGKRQGNPIGITYADMTSSRQAGMATWRHDVPSQTGKRGKSIRQLPTAQRILRNGKAIAH
ncbi:hypothetical protein [uncultured Bacteroides sp.]|uniref:hypothetical protein n=2 Tax=Bacteroidia TaxID=200643 RepID=UPI0025B0D289|nr:hypothetical protein [uncultured Bacteroides sp.]